MDASMTELTLYYLDVVLELFEDGPYPFALLVGDGVEDSGVHDVQHAYHTLHWRP